MYFVQDTEMKELLAQGKDITSCLTGFFWQMGTCALRSSYHLRAVNDAKPECYGTNVPGEKALTAWPSAVFHIG